MSDSFDPERFEPDPPDLGPTSPEIPEQPVPSAPDVSSSPGDESVDLALKVLFWKLVLLYKVALLGLSLGILLVVFDTHASTGVRVVAGSAALFVYALYRTKRGKERLDEGEFESADESEATEQSGDSP